MKEIYLLNKGDSVEKGVVELSLSGDFKVSNTRIRDYNFFEVSKGLDDIILVKNYLPKFIYKVKEGENMMDIMSRGFEMDNIQEINLGDILILNKPKSIRYIVKPLEKLEDIANRFCVNMEEIIVNNNLKTDRLFVGQILWI